MAMSRVFAVAFVMSVMVVQLSWGETSFDRQGDEIVPGSEFMQGVFDRVIVDDNQVQSVIINDVIYRVDENTKVTTDSGRSINLTSYKSGTSLDFYVLDGLLTKIMPGADLEEDEGNNSGVAESTNGSEPTELRLEDGVWKN